MKIKIVHIINSLGTGGAEMMLYKLLSRIDREVFEPTVVSLLADGSIEKQIKALGIPVHYVGSGLPLSLLHFKRLVQDLDPDLVQGWMYYGNLAAQVGSLFLPRRIPVIWNIRYSLSQSRLLDEKPMTLASIWVGARLSGCPVRIVNNSITSAEQHGRRMGYRRDRWEIIPNGFDTGLFVPSRAARGEVRRSLGLEQDALLIGLISRFHPQKDHLNFLSAAALLVKRCPQVHFLLAGSGVDQENGWLIDQIGALGLSGKVHLLGERNDTPRVIASLDIATLSSSYGEGFPNVIGEAMSCGVPCVGTDVGDLARIIGETGLVVPPKKADLLAAAWKELVDQGEERRRELGERARRRIMEHFPLDVVTRKYEDLYLRVLSEQKKGESVA